MKFALSGVTVAVMLAVTPVLSSAGPHDRGVNARQHHQQQRIHEGVRQGDLTRGEARHLQREAHDVRVKEREYRADGRFTPAERRDVQRDLDRVSGDIHRERHDGDRRHWNAGSDHPGRGHAYGHNSGGHPGQGHAYGRDRRAQHGTHYGSNYGSYYGGPGRGWGQSIDRRQYDQRERIEQGLRSGALTREEARSLAAEQRAIRQEERAYRSDGVLTRAEREDLWRDLNVAGRNIYTQTHDAERRY